MNSKVYMAKYIISIATNSITDTIREDYKTVMDISNAVDCKIIFRTLLDTILKSVSVNKYSPEIGITIMENEYSKLNLSNTIGDYAQYSTFVNLLIETCSKDYVYSELLGVYKHWIEVADNLSVELKTYIYHSVLNALVKRSLVTEDLEFSEKVTLFVSNNNETYENKQLFDIVVSVLA